MSTRLRCMSGGVKVSFCYLRYIESIISKILIRGSTGKNHRPSRVTDLPVRYIAFRFRPDESEYLLRSDRSGLYDFAMPRLRSVHLRRPGLLTVSGLSERWGVSRCAIGHVIRRSLTVMIE